MKKVKLLASISAITALGGGTTVAATSCSKDKDESYVESYISTNKSIIDINGNTESKNAAELSVGFKNEKGQPVTGLTPSYKITADRTLPTNLKISVTNDGKLDVDSTGYDPGSNEVYMITITVYDVSKTVEVKHAGFVNIALNIITKSPLTSLIVNTTKIPTQITKGVLTQCALSATHIGGESVTIEKVYVESNPFGKVTGAWNANDKKLELIGHDVGNNIVVSVKVTDTDGNTGTGEKIITVVNPAPSVPTHSTISASPTTASVDGYSKSEDASTLSIKYFDQNNQEVLGVTPLIKYESSPALPEDVIISFTNNKLSIYSNSYNPAQAEVYTLTIYAYDQGQTFGNVGHTTFTLTIKHVEEPSLIVDTSKITGPLSQGKSNYFDLSATLEGSEVEIKNVIVESTPTGAINGQWDSVKNQLVLVGQQVNSSVNVKLTVTDTTNHTGIGHVHLAVAQPVAKMPKSSTLHSTTQSLTLAGGSKSLTAATLTPKFFDENGVEVSGVEPSWVISSIPDLPAGLTVDVDASNNLVVDAVNYNPDSDTSYEVTIKAQDKYQTLDPSKVNGVTITVEITHSATPEHSYAISKYGETTVSDKWVTQAGQYAYFTLTDKGTESATPVNWVLQVDKASLQGKIRFLEDIPGLLYIPEDTTGIDGAKLTISAKNADETEVYATRDLTIEAIQNTYYVTPSYDQPLALKYDTSCDFGILDKNKLPIAGPIKFAVPFAEGNLAGNLSFQNYNCLVLNNSVENFTYNDYVGITTTFNDAAQGEITLVFFYHATPYNISCPDVKTSHLRLEDGQSTTLSLNKIDTKITSGVKWSITNYGTSDPFTAAELKIDQTTGELTLTDYLDRSKGASVTIAASYNGVTTKFNVWIDAIKRTPASSSVSSETTSITIDGKSKKTNAASLSPTFYDEDGNEIKGIYPSWEVSSDPALPTGLKITVDAYNMLQIDSTNYNPDSSETFTITIKANTREKVLAAEDMQPVTITVTINHSYN